MNVELEVAGGDGGSAPVKDAGAELQMLRSELEGIRTTVADDVHARRLSARKTLYCEWSGQSEDGRKHGADLGQDARPFEGASDNRVRLVEKLAREHVRQYVAAATKASPRAIPTESGDSLTAGKVEALVSWVVHNQWGSNWRRSVELLAWFMETDTPAGAVAFVDWERELGVHLRQITSDEVVQTFLASQFGEAGPGEMDAARIAQIVYGPGMEDDLANVLGVLFPGMSRARLRETAVALKADGGASVPEPFARKNLPAVTPMRLYYDVFFPANTTNLQRARVIFRREWITRAEALERVVTMGWGREWVERLVGSRENNLPGFEGQSILTDEEAGRAIDDLDSLDQRKGLFEVWYAYRRAANEDGAIGIYLTTFSAMIHDEPAKESELFDRKHGQYPFVYFPREILSERLIDSRGMPEMFQSDQQSMKLLKDSFEDHVQVTINPPLKVPKGKPRFSLVWEPFGQIEAGARENIEFLQRPPYPQAADKYWEHLRREVSELDGRPFDGMDETAAVMAMQDRVDRFLSSLADVLMMVVQLCQEFMGDEQIARVVGPGGLEIARSVEEIQGKFDIRLSYDVRDLNMDMVIEKAKFAVEYLRRLDSRAQLPYERMAANFLALIDPTAAEMVQAPEQADEREIREERAFFVQMLNGVEPPMQDGGINAALRLQVLQQLIGERRSNPGAYPPVSPMAQALVENRLKYLEFQGQQMENADIGRVGTKPVEAAGVEV